MKIDSNAVIIIVLFVVMLSTMFWMLHEDSWKRKDPEEAALEDELEIQRLEEDLLND